MEVWPELSSHLRAVDYNVGAVLAAFLLGFVIQFTLRQDAMTNTEFKIIFRVREFLLLHPSPSNLRNQLSSRGDYYSNPVIRDRKDGGNNLVTGGAAGAAEDVRWWEGTAGLTAGQTRST